MSKMQALVKKFSSDGRVDWIGLRPERRAPMLVVDEVEVTATGLVGDRRKSPGKRAVTLIQAEHLPVIAAFAGLETVAPEILRRNILVSGINLLALRHHEIRIDDVILRTTGPCAPCSLMEDAMGYGGYNAMRGHGGLTAEVVQGGTIKVGSVVTPVLPADD